MAPAGRDSSIGESFRPGPVARRFATILAGGSFPAPTPDATTVRPFHTIPSVALPGESLQPGSRIDELPNCPYKCWHVERAGRSPRTRPSRRIGLAMYTHVLLHRSHE